MLKLIQQPDIGFVNKLLGLIEQHGGCPDEKYKRVWVRLSNQGVYFHNTDMDKKCTVVVFGAVSVEYMFLEADGSNGVKKISTIDDVDAITKEIISYFDEGYTND